MARMLVFALALTGLGCQVTTRVVVQHPHHSPDVRVETEIRNTF